MESADRHVGEDEIGGVRISTVFLGIDHSFDDGPPMLYETMIFGGPHNEETWRYSTWDEAEIGHAEAIKLVMFGEAEKERMSFDDFLRESAELIEVQRKRRE
jgi:hypothetical protein